MGRFLITALTFGCFCQASHAQLTQQPIRINVGGPAVTDANGTVWSADTCTGDLPISISGVYTSPIYNDAGFNAGAAPITCNFVVVPGLYNVVFGLIEPFTSFNTPKRRIFDILINGLPIVSAVDIFARAGAVRTRYGLLVTVRTDGPLNISFVSVKSPAMVAGIEIVPLAEFVYNTVGDPLIGATDGLNKIFNLAHTPSPPASVAIYQNGLRLQAIRDYVVSGITVIMVIPPPVGSVLQADYTWLQGH